MPAQTHSQSANQSTVRVVPGGPVRGKIQPPGSKSLTNRALVCAAFARGKSILTGTLRSEDTAVMIQALRQIGVSIEVVDGGRKLVVDGSARQTLGKSSPMRELFIANSGTTVRFLTAALSASGGHFRLHGVDRMHQRPIGDLVDALHPIQNGNIEPQSAEGCPPVLIQSDGWSGREIVVSGSVSSQYLSGLMMAAPIANEINSEPTQITVQGDLVSLPYVEMTAEVIRSFGGEVTLSRDGKQIEIGSARYQPQAYNVEPDASAASYFWAAAAITSGDVTVKGLSEQALQGDVGFCDVLKQMGCTVDAGSEFIRVIGTDQLSGVDVDMNHISDTVQTLALVALFAKGPTRVRGVAHNRFKETDRIGDLARELRKLGAVIVEHEDGMTIEPPAGGARGIRPATLETYHDHRMAMSLCLAGLGAEGVHILNPSCTGKTYPEFFADLEQLLGRAHQWSASAPPAPTP